MQLTPYIKAAPRGMLAAVVIAFVLLNGLGAWQLYRLQWKEHLIADLARTEAMAPVPVQTLLGQATPSWRAASLPACPLDTTRFLYMHSEVDGVPGFRVLTACPAGKGAVLVDLGFTTQKLAGAKMTMSPIGRLRPYEKAGMVTPVNRPADHDWYWRSAADMGPALGAAVRDDYFIVLDVAASGLHMAGLQQGPLTAPLPNRHFEYALTWFGLGWAMIGVFVSFLIQRVRKPA